jgi:hypothetical protein
MQGTKSTTTGEIKKFGQGYGEQNNLSVISRFVRGKLAPVPATIVDALSKTNIVGEEVTPSSLLTKSLFPLIVNDIYDAMQDNSVGVSIGLGAIATLGVGVQSYPSAGWWKDQTISSGGDKVNALGEKPKEVDSDLWKFIKENKIRVAPQNKSNLRTYDEKENKLIKYTDKQYFDYVKARGEYLKKSILAIEENVKNDTIYNRLSRVTTPSGQPFFKNKEEIQKSIKLVLDRQMDAIRVNASRFGMEKATGRKNPPEFYIKLRDIIGSKSLPVISDSTKQDNE